MARRLHSESRRGLLILMLVAALVAGSAAVCQVWTRLRAIDYGYKISKASSLQTQLTEANRRLRLEIALLTSPTRIARIANEELGLQPPAPEQVRRLWKNGAATRGQRTVVARHGAEP